MSAASTEVTIACHPYDWNTVDGKTADGTMTILCWALGNVCSLETPIESLSSFDDRILVRIEDYYPYLLIELPYQVNGLSINWSDMELKFFTKLGKILKDDRPVEHSIIEREPIYYYHQGNKNKYLELTFRNEDALRHCFNILNNKPFEVDITIGKHAYRVFEHKIDAVRKLLTKTDIQFSAWFSCVGVIPDERISTCRHEYIVSYKTMKELPIDVTKKWITYPNIISFDIETYSPNPLALPDRDAVGNDVYIISCIYYNAKYPDEKKRIALVSADCYFPDNADEVIHSANEHELLMNFCDVISKYDPEIITGYNILGYDIPYMEARMRRLRTIYGDWKNMTRLHDRKTVVKKMSWASSGAGINELEYFLLPGRICVDLLLVVKRDYKFPKYTLEYVSQSFLGVGKHDMKAKRMFEIYETSKKIEKRIRKLEQQSIALDIEHPEHHELIEKKNAAKKDMTDVVSYALQDGDLCIRLFEKLNVWIALIQMSCILGIPPIQLFTRGQGVRFISQMYHLAHKQGYILDSRQSSMSEYIGATVLDPTPGFYENVICLDFSSLYPSIIMAYNICMSTFIDPSRWEEVDKEKCHIVTIKQTLTKKEIEEAKKRLESQVNQPDYASDDSDSDDDSDEDENDLITVEREHRFIKQQYKQGLLPMLVGSLVNERSAVRKQLGKETDEVVKVILDKKQLALKISANSCYGALGASTSSISLLEGAESVTAMGRQLIQRANEFVLHHYPSFNVCYGDTDSTFIQVTGKRLDELNSFGEELGKHVSTIFPHPLKMEFEKAGHFLFLKKKKYIGYIVNDDGTFKKDKKTGKKYMFERGIVLQRRDTSQLLRDCYSSLAHCILSGGSIVEGYQIVMKYMFEFLHDRFDLKDVSIIKTLNSTYKSQSYHMNIFGQYLKSIGQPMAGGSRLEYVVVETDNPADKVGNKMRLVEQLLAEDNKEKIDVKYYIEKTFLNAIDQLFEIGYLKYQSELMQLGYVPKNNPPRKNVKRQRYGLNQPVGLLCGIMKDFSKKGKLTIKGYTPRELLPLLDLVHQQNVYDLETLIRVQNELKERPTWVSVLPQDIRMIHERLEKAKTCSMVGGEFTKYDVLLEFYHSYHMLDNETKEKRKHTYEDIDNYMKAMKRWDVMLMKEI